MELLGGPVPLLSVVQFLGAGGKTAAVVELDFSLHERIWVRYLNVGRTLHFSTSVPISGQLQISDITRCHVLLKDLVSCLSCFSHDMRVEVTLDGSTLTLAGHEPDGSRMDFELRTLFSDFPIGSLDIETDGGSSRITLEADVLATGFLQCFDSSAKHVYFTAQVGDPDKPLIEIKSRIVGRYDTDVEVPTSLGSDVAGMGSYEMILHGKDVGGIYHFLSTMGGLKVAVTVSSHGLKLVRKLVTGNDGIMNVLGGRGDVDVRIDS